MTRFDFMLFVWVDYSPLLRRLAFYVLVVVFDEDTIFTTCSSQDVVVRVVLRGIEPRDARGLLFREGMGISHLQLIKAGEGELFSARGCCMFIWRVPSPEPPKRDDGEGATEHIQLPHTVSMTPGRGYPSSQMHISSAVRCIEAGVVLVGSKRDCVSVFRFYAPPPAVLIAGAM